MFLFVLLSQTSDYIQQDFFFAWSVISGNSEKVTKIKLIPQTQWGPKNAKNEGTMMCKMIRSPWKRPCFLGGGGLGCHDVYPYWVAKTTFPLPHLPTPGSRGRRKKKNAPAIAGGVYLSLCLWTTCSQPNAATRGEHDGNFLTVSPGQNLSGK